MSTPDRLAELQRQRALVQQHLAWLDREIQTAQTGAPSASQPLPGPLGIAIAPAVPPTPFTSIPDADAGAIIGQYRTDEKSLTSDVRKGCFLYAAGALAVLALGVLGLYFLLRH